MRRETGIRSDNLVSRSLRITGSTRMVVAAVSGAVALNGTIAMQSLGAAGQAVVVAVVFASVAVGALAISNDVFARSSQAVASLKSIGASRRSMSAAVAASVVVYGALGSAAGALAGGALGAGLAGGGFDGGLLVEASAVVASSCAAIAAGVYAGGRAAWRS
jgi:hypothetical protein